MANGVNFRRLAAPSLALALSLTGCSCGDDSPAVTPALVVDVPAGAQTTEARMQATFTVALDHRPSRDVAVSVASSDPSEGTVTTSSLVFTRDNWNAPQTVVVTGVDDDVADGSQAYAILLGPSVSEAANFAGLTAEVPLTNVDDESPGITVTPALGAVDESGTTTTFTVVLHSEPTADVVLSLASDDEGEGTLSTASLTFTSLNWNAPQVVTITGVDDVLVDGDQVFHVAVTAIASADAGYASLVLPAPIAVTNVDDEMPRIVVDVTDDASGEDGTTATFSLALGTQPTGDVTLTLTSTDASEGEIATSTTLVFTAADFATPRTVTVAGLDDDLADGDQPYAIAVTISDSQDTDYAALDDVVVDLVNDDDDTAGFAISAPSGHTAEDGTTATFTVALSSEPLADVTITFDTDDAGEGVPDALSLTFTPDDWDQPQTVTVTGQDDDVDDGAQPYQIVFADVTSTDPGYAPLLPANVVMTNDDDDDAGFTVSAASGPTHESGTTATFTVVLTSEPTADVVLSFDTDDAGEGTPDVTTLTFTSADWDQPQTVTVAGVDDVIVDGDVAYAITFDPAQSADPEYDGLVPASVSLTNEDDGEICYCPYAGDDFEDGLAQDFTEITQTLAVVDTDGADGTSQSITVSGGSYSHLGGVVHAAPACLTTRFSVWLKPSAGNASHNYVVLGNDSVSATNAILFFFAQGSTGTFRIVSSSTVTTPFVPGVWVKLVVDIDWATRTIDASIDGVPFATDHPFRNTSIDTLTRVHLYNYENAVGRYDELEFETTCL